MIRGTPPPAPPATTPIAGGPRLQGAGANASPFDPFAGTAVPVPVPMPASTSAPMPCMVPLVAACSAANPVPGAPVAAPALPAAGAPPVPAPPTVELHVEHSGGRVEVVSLPWRLVSSGTLSQRFEHDQAIARAGTPAARQTSVGVQPAEVPMTHPAMQSELAVAPQESTDGHAPAVPAGMRAPAPVESPAEADPSSRMDQAMPQAQPWLERLYRWVERAGLDPSLWIRDYRLAPEQVRDLASTLQSLARERGVALHRIVVNGREAWHAQATASASGSASGSQRIQEE